MRRRGVRLLGPATTSPQRPLPEIAEALGAPARAVLDGEVVAFAGSRTSFQRSRCGRGWWRSIYYVFDVLWPTGRDVRALPAAASASGCCASSCGWRGPIRFTPHRREKGTSCYAEACRRGWEGLIAKRADSPYVGKRSRDWLKLKCDAEQELVIGGYTAPKGSRTSWARCSSATARTAGCATPGKVGPGSTARPCATWPRGWRRCGASDPPFVDAIRACATSPGWSRELVAQVGFTEWTRDGRLRHPRFLGLREDKEPREVVRECRRERARASVASRQGDVPRRRHHQGGAGATTTRPSRR